MKPACWCLVLIVGMFLFACRKQQKAEHSFYYWKTSINYNIDEDTTLIRSLQVQHFYIRYFDVDWSENMNMPIPVGQLSSYTAQYNSWPFTSSYTPVVFITNRTFQRITDAWCDTLALRLKQKLINMSAGIEKTAEDHDYWLTPLPDQYRWEHQDSIRNVIRQRRKNTCTEIQIDCDWTAGTKDKYFRFLKSLKQQFPDKKISVTVRLYPYKYHDKTGVPPVDKGMLMCYNLSDIRNPATRNSVFDVKELKQYLIVKDYPLPLDVALPVFGWQAWFRGNTFQGILYDRDGKLLSDTVTFKKQNNHNRLVTADQVIGNNYLREGDVLRQEYPEEKELEAAADLLRDEFPKAGRIAFYYWDTDNLKRYETTIHKIYNSW